jgi:hypothetical protein
VALAAQANGQGPPGITLAVVGSRGSVAGSVASSLGTRPVGRKVGLRFASQVHLLDCLFLAASVARSNHERDSATRRVAFLAHPPVASSSSLVWGTESFCSRTMEGRINLCVCLSQLPTKRHDQLQREQRAPERLREGIAAARILRLNPFQQPPASTTSRLRSPSKALGNRGGD